ncbi:MAG: molybdopterin-dependent oxidoreductase alpha subunit [Polaribacter sp.]|jgi:molybdopterin-dependent oxidoreductase alpha subunit
MKKTKYTLPTDKEKIELSKPAEVAAGATAVWSALKKGYSQMSVHNCTKGFLNLNQTKGFDCPSCAWPDPKPSDRSGFAEYCENGAKAVTEEATSRRANVAFWKNNSIEEMMTWSEMKLGKVGRITEPMVLKPGATHYEPISWEDAFQHIATELNALDNPNEAAFYTSGRTSNEAAFLYQLFVRQFGTNNLPDCSNMCHETSGSGLSQTIGIGKGTVKLEDFYITDLVIVIGQNPGTNHPRMMSALQKAKRNGAKIISINPLAETGLKKFKNPQELSGWVGAPTQLCDLFLQVKINEDIALLKAILRILIEKEDANPGTVVDHEFVEKHTTGYDDFVKDIRTQSVEDLAKAAGISIADIQEAATIIASAKKMIICWAMGITQHTNGVNNIKEIVNLLLLRGAIGVPGAGACPVRGHSNVQGDRTMGIWEKLKPAFGAKLSKRFNFEPPKEDGYNAVTAIKAMHAKKVKVFFALGGNLLLAAPDTEYTADAMRNCKLTVMVSTKPNRNHLVTGKTAIILPCLGRTEHDVQTTGEQFVSVENSMGIVHKSKGVLKPASPDLISEPQIVARLAKATLKDKYSVNWLEMASNYDLIRDVIEDCIPGFDNYNERIRREGGFYLPNGPRERTFTTGSGKALFSVVPTSKNPLKDDEFLMTTLRNHDQFNTTIYGNEDRYRGINGRRVVMVNKKDMKAAGLKTGDYVDLVNNFGGVERVAPNFSVVPFDIPSRCVATYFPEANVLVPMDKYDAVAHTPASKSVVVRLLPL